MSNNTHDCEIFFFVFLQHASCIASCGITIRICFFLFKIKSTLYCVLYCSHERMVYTCTSLIIDWREFII